MDNDKQIVHYLEEFAKALTDLQVTQPFHMLITGGAYMLLQKKRRFTLDIDFALIQSPRRARPKKVFGTTVQRIEVSRRTSTVPFAAEFKLAVGMVAQRHRDLLDDWLNDEAAVYFYDDAPHVEVTFWRSFGDLIFVYLPTMEYMLATKIAAYRPKDADDIQMLIQDLNIRTRAQAKAIVDKFLLPDAQQFWEVEEKLEILFP
jgi:hypothetical protein